MGVSEIFFPHWAGAGDREAASETEGRGSRFLSKVDMVIPGGVEGLGGCLHMGAPNVFSTSRNREMSANVCEALVEILT